MAVRMRMLPPGMISKLIGAVMSKDASASSPKFQSYTLSRKPPRMSKVLSSRMDFDQSPIRGAQEKTRISPGSRVIVASLSFVR